MLLSYFSPSLKEKPLVPFVEHVNDHFLPWNICESWLQARSVFCYLAVSFPVAQSRGLSKPLSTLPGEVENSTTAGKCNQGEQEPRLSGPFPFHPPYQTHFRKPTWEKQMRMGRKWSGKWELWLETPRSLAWMQMSSLCSTHMSVSAKFPVSDILEFANLYFIFLNTLLE